MRGRTVAPLPPPTYLRRPRLEERLRDVLARRLSCVVADAGFGKSTLLAAFAGRVNCAWYTLSAADAAVASLAGGIVAALRARMPAFPADVAAAASAAAGRNGDDSARTRALAGLVSDALADQLSDLVLVLDDVEQIDPGAPSVAFLEALCLQIPPTVHLVLASRAPAPFSIDRLRADGQVVEVGAADLAFTRDEVAAVLSRVAGPSASDLAERLYTHTDGWPAAVVMGAEAVARSPVRERSRVFDELGVTDDLVRELAGNAIAKQDERVRHLIRLVAHLDRFTHGLCIAIGIEESDDALRQLHRAGLLVEDAASPDVYSLNATLARFIRSADPLDPADERALLIATCDWFAAHGEPATALRCATAAGDAERTTSLLAAHGQQMLADGTGADVLDAAARVAIAIDDPRVRCAVGDAWAATGDLDRAIEVLDPSGGDGPLDASLAWRVASAFVKRGDVAAAARTFERAAITGADTKEEGLLLAMRSQTSYLLGLTDECATEAKRALAIAIESGDDRTLAAAHTANAWSATLSGDAAGQREHWRRALDHAERAGYVPWIVTIRHNQVRMLVMEDAYDEALNELAIILDLAEAAGLVFEAAVALTSRAAVRNMRGALEEAVADLRPAVVQLDAIDSPFAEYALRALGNVQRDRGDLAAAREAYERAIRVAERTGDAYGLTLALAGLARVIVETDPDHAGEVMERALAIGVDTGDPSVQISAAIVALARGLTDDARTFAAQALSIAGDEGDRAGTAEALEVLAAAVVDADEGKALLLEALGIWSAIGAPLGEARTMLSLATTTRGSEARDHAERAERALRTIGARRAAADASALLRRLDQDAHPNVAIRTLGGLVVERGGVRVALSEWQSKKARDLLKILVARRGRPASREQLIDLLWPDEDLAKASNRLSVALSTIRNVLDPNKRDGSDRYVTGDQSSVGLAISNLVVDVEGFLSDARQGLELRRDSPDAAITYLLRAEGAYGGDFLEEDAYAEWAVALREEARSAYMDVARALAEEASLAGDDDSAVRFLLRILERDPFDERAHLQFVEALERSARHGEARRAYNAYSSKMEEIGVECAPFPHPASNRESRSRG